MKDADYVKKKQRSEPVRAGDQPPSSRRRKMMHRTWETIPVEISVSNISDSVISFLYAMKKIPPDREVSVVEYLDEFIGKKGDQTIKLLLTTRREECETIRHGA